MLPVPLIVTDIAASMFGEIATHIETQNRGVQCLLLIQYPVLCLGSITVYNVASRTNSCVTSDTIATGPVWIETMPCSIRKFFLTNLSTKDVLNSICRTRLCTKLEQRRTSISQN